MRMAIDRLWHDIALLHNPYDVPPPREGSTQGRHHRKMHQSDRSTWAQRGQRAKHSLQVALGQAICVRPSGRVCQWNGPVELHGGV